MNTTTSTINRNIAAAQGLAQGVISMQTFAAKRRVLVAGVLADGLVICDGDQSYMVSETELSQLIDEVERLS